VQDDYLLPYCRAQGIQIEAYTSLGQGHHSLVRNPTVVDIAARYDGCTPAAVLLRWAVQRHGIPVIPRSSNPKHIAANAPRHVLGSRLWTPASSSSASSAAPAAVSAATLTSSGAAAAGAAAAAAGPGLTEAELDALDALGYQQRSTNRTGGSEDASDAKSADAIDPTTTTAATTIATTTIAAWSPGASNVANVGGNCAISTSTNNSSNSNKVDVDDSRPVSFTRFCWDPSRIA
jgi:hypothetical protein